jgi:hypothetical protein
METDRSPLEMWKGTDKINKLIGSREHDSVIAIPLDETAFENYVLDHLFGVRPKSGEIFYKLTDNSILSSAQSMRSYGFSDKWYNRYKSTLADYGVKIVENNPFQFNRINRQNPSKMNLLPK